MAARKKDAAQGALLDQDSTQAGVAPSPTTDGLRGSDSPDGSGQLHVARVSLRRFGGVGEEPKTFDFGPGANVITGDNASGKTTLLSAIRCALRITRATAAGNVHEDSAEDPEIVVTLRGAGQEYTVTAKGDDSPTVREVVAGEVRDVPRPVQFLKDLVDVAGADPAAFERARPDEQAAMLLEALEFAGYDRKAALAAAGLEGFRLPAIPAGLHPLEDLERIVQAVEDARRATGSERDTEKATAAKLLKDLPAAPPADVAGAVAQGETATANLAAEIAHETEAAEGAHREAEARIRGAFGRESDRLKAALGQKAAEIREAAEKRIAELSAETETAIDAARTAGERELDAAEAALQKARESIQAREKTLAEGREKLAALRQQATNVETDRRLRQTAQEAAAKGDAHAARWAALDASIKALKRYATDLAGKAPIPGLEVGFDEKGKREVRLDGKGLDKLSGYELTALSARVAALRSRQGGTERPLRLILIDEIGRTTLSRRKALLAELTEGGAQVIAALASEAGKDLSVEGADAV